MTSIDDIITSYIGSIGCYQIFLILLLFLCRFPDVWHQVVLVIVSPPPGDFTCSNKYLAKCDPKCPSHEFDHSVWEKTIIHEWDLVCDKKYIPSAIQSIIMSGILFGNITCGYIADRFGRHYPLCAGVFLHLVAGIAAAFTPWLWLYILLRWLCTFGVGSTIICSFTIVMEFTHRTYRPIVGILFAVPCNIAQALLGVIGYYFRRWDTIQLIISVPSILLLSYLCLIPESPRWLITVGRVEPVVKIIETAAKCNKLPTENIRQALENYLKENPAYDQKSGGNIVELFRTKRMRTKTVTLMLVWFLTCTAFFGLVQRSGEIDGNIFLNIAFAGLLMIPMNVLACLLIKKLGRKKSIAMFYSMSSAAIGITTLKSVIRSYPQYAVQICLYLSSATLQGGFSCLFVYSGELFPTIIRTVGMGIGSMSGRIGCMIVPFVFVSSIEWLPPLTFAVLLAIAVFLIIVVLPETSGVPLPNTVEDADKL